jgi:hypothetical protein
MVKGIGNCSVQPDGALRRSYRNYPTRKALLWHGASMLGQPARRQRGLGFALFKGAHYPVGGKLDIHRNQIVDAVHFDAVTGVVEYCPIGFIRLDRERVQCID